MGFSDSFIKTVSRPNSFSTTAPAIHPSTTENPSEKSCFEDLIEKENSSLIPDEEILASTESIYFEEDADTGVYVLNVSDNDTVIVGAFIALILFLFLFFFVLIRNFPMMN